MGDESDCEEELLVFAEFQDNINLGKYGNFHILGINDKNPVVQMDETFFMGNYESALGTYMFFDEDPEPHCSDPLFGKLPERNLKYLFKTRKLLKMDHAYVTPKEGTELDLQIEEPKEDDIAPVAFETLQEAIEKFKSEWDPNYKPDITSSTIDNASSEITTDTEMKCD